MSVCDSAFVFERQTSSDSAAGYQHCMLHADVTERSRSNLLLTVNNISDEVMPRAGDDVDTLCGDREAVQWLNDSKLL